MQPNNTGVTSTQPDEGIFLCERRWELSVTSEMALIENLDGIFVLGRSMFR